MRITRSSTLTQLLIIAALMAPALWSSAWAEPLTGLAYLMGADQPVKSSTLTNPAVESIVLRTHWKTVEPTEGAYKFTYYSGQIPKVLPAKPFSLGVAAGTNAPPWLYSAGVKPFSFVDQDGAITTTPLYFDPVYLTKYSAVITAMGATFKATPPGSVYIGCGNSKAGDWFLSGQTTDVNNLLAQGYTSQKMIDACLTLLDVTAKAFPSSQIRLPIGTTPQALDKTHTTTYVVDTILKTAEQRWPGKLIALSASASATTLTADKITSGKWLTMKTTPTQRGFQALWFAAGDTTCRMNGGKKPCVAATMLNTMINTMKTYGINYGEIYGADFDSTDAAVKTVLDANSTLQ